MQALIFDLGGVLLVEGEPIARRRWESTLGLTEGELEVRRREAVGVGWAGGRSEEEIRASLGATLGLDPDKIVELLADLDRDAHLDPILTTFLGQARRRYRVGVLANNGPDARAGLIGQLGLEEMVDLVVISGEEGVAKPDPAIYQLAAERLGVDPGGCVFIDDQPANVVGAERTGMTAIHHLSSEGTRAALRRVLGMIEHDYRAAGGVVLHDDRALLLRRESRNEWRLPKGHVEAGESDEAAALREVTEEGGYNDLVVTADLGIRHLDVDAFVDDGPGHHVVRDEHYYKMTLVSWSQVDRDPAEWKFEPTWVPVESAADLLTYDLEKEWLSRAVSS